MTDWTDTVPAPFGVSYFSSYMGIHSVGAATGTLTVPASAVYPAANRALFIPFRLMSPVRITKLWALNGAAVSGNLDLGIYNADGVRLVSTGSTAQSGTSAMQIILLTTAVRLSVGLFYMAITVDNITATIQRGNPALRYLQVVGMAQQASAFPLPASATLAVAAAAYVPVIGFISEEG